MSIDGTNKKSSFNKLGRLFMAQIFKSLKIDKKQLNLKKSFY